MWRIIFKKQWFKTLFEHNLEFKKKKKTNPALVFHRRLLSWLIPDVLPPDISRNKSKAPNQLWHLQAQPGNKVCKREIRLCPWLNPRISVGRFTWMGNARASNQWISQFWKNSDLFPELISFSLYFHPDFEKLKSFIRSVCYLELARLFCMLLWTEM